MAREKRLQVYLQSEEFGQLKEWSEETGKSMSDLARDAILEYADVDRYDRIERELAHVTDSLERIEAAVSDGPAHTHKDTLQVGTSETVQKTREIASRLNHNHDDVMDASDVDRAIKDIAGGDPRTVDKYRQELKERSLAFEHPNPDSSTWFLSVDKYLSDLEGYANQTQKPEAIIQREVSKYGITFPEAREKMETLQ
ncbi:MAG: hypothetical protein ACOCUO_02970 [archaeon]